MKIKVHRLRGRIAIATLIAVCAVAIPEPASPQVRKPARRAPARAVAQPQAKAIVTVNIPFAAAKPVLEGLAGRLPAGLEGKSLEALAVEWPGWVARRDADIRKRLGQGDEDSIVNFMLFGVSFTKQPRATSREIARVMQEGRTPEDVILARIRDLAAGIAKPGQNERLLFARSVVERKGINPTTPAGLDETQNYILESTKRFLREGDSYNRAIAAARLAGDSSAVFAERSTLYRERGLSSDTSLSPDYGIERSLEELKAKGILTAGSVRRIAIVGPGLDFTDKGEGYDVYPQQTIQPFAVIDSLRRLGLAKEGDLRLTTFDLSDRINAHLAAAGRRAAAGSPYVVHLPRDMEAGWDPGLVSYWERFGDRIGRVSSVTSPEGLSTVRIRSIEIRPDVVALIRPADLNVVLQRPEGLAASERFDLVIATNILVYYDVFEQSLALANVATMLRPGGILLSNNALYELPATPMRSAGYTAVAYSSKADDGDYIVWYQRQPDPVR